MKPIETIYGGCRFRSRLEARWAVFFDNLKLKWDYEPEGFTLSSGVNYLPDFWLPQLGCWFEVKGPEPTDQDREKAYQLSIDSKKTVVLASGQIKTTKMAFKNYEWEWPSDGFRMEFFAGQAWEVWNAKAFDHALWNWTLDTDLPPFISDQFPDQEIPEIDGEARRKLLIELDEIYYQKKYSKPHPRYRWGRYQDNVNWILTTSDEVMLALEPNDSLTIITDAYSAAKKSRFEHGECG
jgi:hypothetical protein